MLQAPSERGCFYSPPQSLPHTCTRTCTHSHHFLPPLPSSPLSLPFSFSSLPLPGFGSCMECCISFTGISCLHCFLCMTLYAVSMLKNKQKTKKGEKHSTKSNDTFFFGQKIITFKVIVSVSNLDLRCCLSVLLVSLWLCFASMRPCSLWKLLGEEEPCVQGFGDSFILSAFLRVDGSRSGRDV